MTRFFVLLVAFLCLSFSSFASEAGFGAWKQNFAKRAEARGIGGDTIAVFLREAEYLPKIIELDRKQPESTKTFAQYLTTAVSQSRIDNGRNALRDNASAFSRAQSMTGVPKNVIAALWGMETSYGSYTGDWGVLSTLSTLAYDGRRTALFEGELIAALKILDQHKIPVGTLRGSWAGAMGQTQFMPSSYLSYAVDGDGDGKKDIWTNRMDALPSAGNYLARSGWNSGLPWGAKATLTQPLSKASLGGGASGKFVGLIKGTSMTMDGWQRLGVRSDLRVPASTPLWLSIPDGPNGQAFLVTNNYRVIMKWNNSSYFASSVGLLSDYLAHGGSVTVPSHQPSPAHRSTTSTPSYQPTQPGQRSYDFNH